MKQTKNYRIAQLDEIPAIPCPCGSARRAFTEDPDRAASIHVVEIKEDSEVHYHERQTEVYYVLEGEGSIELDGERLPLRPGTSVLIKPGCRHRAVGKLRVLNFVVPAFDPADEHSD
jgi:mannose-6-phosphate isomerase-like protein (cupin superfamily)